MVYLVDTNVLLRLANASGDRVALVGFATSAPIGQDESTGRKADQCHRPEPPPDESPATTITEEAAGHRRQE